MSAYRQLSIVVYGSGEDPNHRSHWAFALHKPGSNTGNILHVNLLDSSKFLHHFEIYRDVGLKSESSEGYFKIAELTPEQSPRAAAIISDEQAPNNGKDKCQEWIVNCIISLEAEEVVPPGTSEWIGDLVGLSAGDLKGRVGENWTGNRV
ncbi:hypothetical protein IWX49DRAFT_327951 [Phyllosticta citricarpa]|uniref:Uncharacterized protein n=2 Tax=Phyllosticta TaxID=121621 RepID=A0ABR1LFN9_9PEZI